MGTWDWILASDVITLRAEVSALCKTLAELLHSGSAGSSRRRPRVILSHERRSDYDEQLDYFEAEAAKRGLDVMVLSQENAIDPCGRQRDIYVLEVVRSSSAWQRCASS